MKQTVFVLGRETELCLAELKTVLGAVDPAATIQNLSTGGAIVQLTGPLDPQWWIHRLGGTRLIARVIGTVPQLTAAVLDALVPAGVRELALSSPLVSASERMKLLLQLKKLRSGLRYRPAKNAFSVSTLSERLIRRDDGLELLVLPNPTPSVGLMVAEAVAVQDTRAWTERDMGLPAPDAFVGMLPPKVARIMVNLAEPARHNLPTPGVGRLLDPFCGSGQIPIEALRLGWNVTASDLDAGATDRTTQNVTWARTRSLEAAKATWGVFRAGVDELPDQLSVGSFDAIVTEPDLGPALMSSTAVPSEKILNGVTATIARAFDAGRTLIRSGGRMVIVVPIIAGNRITDRLDDSVFSGYLFRETLHYARPDSRVEREIVVLDRT
jgi:tRNA G10  N-methylase Trm11